MRDAESLGRVGRLKSQFWPFQSWVQEDAAAPSDHLRSRPLQRRRVRQPGTENCSRKAETHDLEKLSPVQRVNVPSPHGVGERDKRVVRRFLLQDYEDELENGRGRRHSSPGGSRGNPRDYGHHHLHPDNLVSG